eukprot:gene1091-54368_t
MLAQVAEYLACYQSKTGPAAQKYAKIVGPKLHKKYADCRAANLEEAVVYRKLALSMAGLESYGYHKAQTEVVCMILHPDCGEFLLTISPRRLHFSTLLGMLEHACGEREEWLDLRPVLRDASDAAPTTWEFVGGIVDDF